MFSFHHFFYFILLLHSTFSLRASIILEELGTNLSTNFPLGAYAPLEFKLLVDESIKLRESRGLIGIAVRSCIMYPQYYCADWLPILTNGKSATPWTLQPKVNNANDKNTKTNSHKNTYGFALPSHWHLPVNSFHGLVQLTVAGLNKVTIEAQFCISKHRCADIISSSIMSIQVNNDTLCAHHPIIAQLSALRRKRSGRKIISPKSLMQNSLSKVSAVMIHPGGTALSLHQLPISFMFFNHATASNNTNTNGTGTIRSGPIPGKICVHVQFGAFASQTVSSCMRSEVLDGENDMPLPWHFLPSELGVSGITTGKIKSAAPILWGLRFGLTSPDSSSATSPSVHLFGELLVSISVYPDDSALGVIHSSVETAIMTNSWAYNPSFQPALISEDTIAAATLHSSRRHCYVSFIWGEEYAKAALVLARGLQQVGSSLEYMVVIMTRARDVNVISDTTMAQLRNSPEIDRVIVVEKAEGYSHGKINDESMEMIKRLQKYNTLLFSGVRGIGVPHTYDTRVFSKLLAFSLLEYNSVAVIDVDVVVVKNIDAALIVVDPTNNIEFAGVGLGYFSSAFFVLHPNLKILSEMIQVIHECDSWRFPEQDLLNMFFGAGHAMGKKVHQRFADIFLCHAETVKIERSLMETNNLENENKIEQSKCLLLEFASCGMKPWHLNAISTDGVGLCYPERRSTNLWDAGIRRWQQLQDMLL